MSIYSILDALDEEAADWYVDEGGDLKVEVAERLRLLAGLLLAGGVSVGQADVLWPQWWATITAFASGYALDGLEAIRSETQALRDEAEQLTDRDVLFLDVLRDELDGYLAHRESGAPGRYNGAAEGQRGPGVCSRGRGRRMR